MKRGGIIEIPFVVLRWVFSVGRNVVCDKSSSISNAGSPWSFPGTLLSGGALQLGDFIFMFFSKGVSSLFRVFLVAAVVIVAWLTAIRARFVRVRPAFILGFGGQSLRDRES